MRQPAKRASPDSQPVARHNLGEQLTLVHEDIFDVARGLIAALGGAKAVAPQMFPQKSADAATRYLLDCLNPNRDHDIGLEGFLFLLRLARQRGIHLGIEWLADELGYTRPSPVDPGDARAELQRQFIDAVNRAERLAQRLK